MKDAQAPKILLDIFKIVGHDEIESNKLATDLSSVIIVKAIITMTTTLNAEARTRIEELFKQGEGPGRILDELSKSVDTKKIQSAMAIATSDVIGGYIDSVEDKLDQAQKEMLSKLVLDTGYANTKL